MTWKKDITLQLPKAIEALFLECANLVSSLSLSVGLKCLSFPDLKASGEKKRAFWKDDAGLDSPLKVVHDAAILLTKAS